MAHQMMYQLQAQSQIDPGHWFACTVRPIDWRLLLGMVALWRKANPDYPLRAVKWEDAI